MKNNVDRSSTGTKARKRFFIETFAVFFVIISPFIFKAHQYLSGDPEATITILGYVVDRNGFADLNTYAWFLLSKIVPFYLLLIWFFTCKHWWYHTILIPAIMYAFQIFEVVYSEGNIVDTKNILWLLPVCMVVIPFVYLIRIRLYDRYVHGIDLDAMEAELNALKEKRSKIEVKKNNALEQQSPETIEYRSLSEWLDQKLSTDNLESIFKQFQNSLKNWMHLKF
jgi:hypothetical protein